MRAHTSSPLSSGSRLSLEVMEGAPRLSHFESLSMLEPAVSLTLSFASSDTMTVVDGAVRHAYRTTRDGATLSDATRRKA